MRVLETDICFSRGLFLRRQPLFLSQRVYVRSFKKPGKRRSLARQVVVSLKCNSRGRKQYCAKVAVSGSGLVEKKEKKYTLQFSSIAVPDGHPVVDFCVDNPGLLFGNGWRNYNMAQSARVLLCWNPVWFVRLSCAFSVTCLFLKTLQEVTAFIPPLYTSLRVQVFSVLFQGWHAIPAPTLRCAHHRHPHQMRECTITHRSGQHTGVVRVWWVSIEQSKKMMWR